MESKKTIKALNALIKININRIEYYQKASKGNIEIELQDIFADLAHTSKICKLQLGSEVKQLGGTPSEGTWTAGKYYRAWMDVKAKSTGKDRIELLNSCKFGEDKAVFSYSKVLLRNKNTFTERQSDILVAQHKALKADQDKVKKLQDMLVLQY